MIVIWRGRAFLVLLVSAVLAIVFNAVGAIFPFPGGRWVNLTVLLGGPVAAGWLCWSWGRALRRKDGWSHHVYFIPVEWFAVLFILWPVYMVWSAYQYGHDSLVGLVASGPAITEAAPSTPPSAPANRAAPAAPSYPQFKTVAEAQQYAMQRYPTLGIANSPFNAQFLALHKNYQASRPAKLQDPNWPVQLALETEQLLKNKSPDAPR